MDSGEKMDEMVGRMDGRRGGRGYLKSGEPQLTSDGEENATAVRLSTTRWRSLETRGRVTDSGVCITHHTHKFGMSQTVNRKQEVGCTRWSVLSAERIKQG